MTLNSADSLATRASLLERLKDWGDQASWQDFFNSYWQLIYRVGIKSGLTETEAQDAVQDTILAVVKNIKVFQYDPNVCSFKSWLMLITRQRIIWQWRKRTPQSRSIERRSDETARTDTIERIPDETSFDLNAIWDDEWQKNVMATALEHVKAEVNARQYQMFDLYVLENWPVTDVARILRVSTARVYLAKHRISRLLKKEVAKLERGEETGIRAYLRV